MGLRAKADSTASEEILFENSKVSLCLLINRHARSLRVVDFRSGADPAKRDYVLGLAQREGVERAYTVVERDEVASWGRLGFDREGSIPGFYKRSDGFVLGVVVPPKVPGAGLASEESGVMPRSLTRSEPITSRDVKARAESGYQKARRMAKAVLSSPLPPVKLALAREPAVKKAMASAARAGRALTRFEPFGRDVERTDYVATARGGFSLVMSVECQSCFDNAFVELLTAPRTDKEIALTFAAILALTDLLEGQGAVGCFATSPVDDPGLAAAFVGNGFRRTGHLPRHMRVGRKRVDAFLWSRKLAQPDDG